jgi:hypothetical protein
VAGDLMAHRRTPTIITEQQQARADRQQAKANIADLNAFLDLWPTATQAQKIAQVKDLSQILKNTIKAAVL